MKTTAPNFEADSDRLFAHGFFSARGGVSRGIYTSLNCGLGSKDNHDDVLENRQRVAADLGVEPDFLITPWQVHSPTAVIVDEPWQADERPKVDAIVTATPKLAIGILTADCAPVLFCDPHAKVVGAAHAGWRGAVGGVLDDTIAQMEKLGAQRANIAACVGPAIGLAIYEVGEAFERDLLEEHRNNARFFSTPQGAKKVHFDLPAYALHRLQKAGLHNVAALDHCTFAREQQYFSYRRTCKNGEPDYGRQISAIVIR